MSRLARDEGERARHMSKLAMIPDVYRGHNELVNGPRGTDAIRLFHEQLFSENGCPIDAVRSGFQAYDRNGNRSAVRPWTRLRGGSI